MCPLKIATHSFKSLIAKADGYLPLDSHLHYPGHLRCGYSHHGDGVGDSMKKLVLLMLIVSVTVAYADDSKIAPELRNQPATQQTQVIVQYAPGTQVNCSGLLGLVGCLVNDILKLGGQILSQVPIINGVVALLDGNGIHSLSKQSNVVYISPDRPLKPTLSNAASAVNAEFAWQSNYTGAGIGIALIDSGVVSHPDLNLGILPLSRVVYQQSFVPANSSAR